MKLNCWEFKKCGREPGGAKAVELGICPASTDIRFHGTHTGKNAGRSCWIVSGTLCKGELQGEFAKKYKNCLECDFYKSVRTEETPHFINSIFLLKLLETE
jgi:eukaryotic-like serine/threonine-protein kinase